LAMRECLYMYRPRSEIEHRTFQIDVRYEHPVQRARIYIRWQEYRLNHFLFPLFLELLIRLHLPTHVVAHLPSGPFLQQLPYIRWDLERVLGQLLYTLRSPVPLSRYVSQPVALELLPILMRVTLLCFTLINSQPSLHSGPPSAVVAVDSD